MHNQRPLRIRYDPKVDKYPHITFAGEEEEIQGVLECYVEISADSHFFPQIHLVIDGRDVDIDITEDD